MVVPEPGSVDLVVGARLFGIMRSALAVVVDIRAAVGPIVAAAQKVVVGVVTIHLEHPRQIMEQTMGWATSQSPKFNKENTSR
jgi:hypothetical protein